MSQPSATNVMLLPSSRPAVFSAWHGHIAFAHWIVDALRPSSIVELGTHNGASYFAFCSAVKLLGLPTACAAVDTWSGDPHAGFYADAVFNDVVSFNDANFRPFSTLMKMTFDEALSLTPDNSVDLLHIDGLHTYEAVKHDFETWLPKMSSRGVMLFHDTEVRDRGFGVWQLWDELSGRYPGFQFRHSAGLGVLAVGPKVDGSVRELCATPDGQEADSVREAFKQLSAAAQLRGLRLIPRAKNNTRLLSDCHNVALLRPTAQSSVLAQPEVKPHGAVSGTVTGGYGFHTRHEDHPWWSVDLGTEVPVNAIVIYNRLGDDVSYRARNLDVMGSRDGEDWTPIYQHDGSIFGGKDGSPLFVEVEDAVLRHVRIRLRDTQFLHLDEVEVYTRAR